MQLRKFTQTDYWGFAGVESATPLIGESESMICIVDGTTVQTFSTDEAPDVLAGEPVFVTVEFPSEAMAVLAVLGLRGDESSGELLAHPLSLRGQYEDR